MTRLLMGHRVTVRVKVKGMRGRAGSMDSMAMRVRARGMQVEVDMGRSRAAGMAVSGLTGVAVKVGIAAITSAVKLDRPLCLDALKGSVRTIGLGTPVSVEMRDACCYAR